MKKSICVIIIMTLVIVSGLSLMFTFNENANISKQFHSTLNTSHDQFQDKNTKCIPITSEHNLNAADVGNETDENGENIDDFFKENWFIIFIVGTLAIVIPGAYFTFKALKENE